MSHFRIPLIQLVGKLLRVRIVFAHANVVDLQLERTVRFVSQGESDSVNLYDTKKKKILSLKCLEIDHVKNDVVIK